jgi:mono/diheme cytochrome c family protein
VNCSSCHRPGGTAPVDLDLRVDTPLTDTGLCNAPSAGELGIANALLLAPGEPDRSVLLARISRRGLDQMPPIGTNQVDDVAVDVLTQWVRELATCP